MGNCCRTASQIVDPVDVPGYCKFQTAIIVTGKRGKAPGELSWTRGVAIDEATHQIFVANTDGVEIFSETGEYVCQLGVRQLTMPLGIAIHGDSVYVSSWGHTVSRFSLTNISLVRKIGGFRLNNGQFMNPSQLTTDPIGRVFIADTFNNRICIHDPDLNHLHSINLGSRTYPSDVKISRDRIYVLCLYGKPCMLVLTLEGDKLHSLIIRGEGTDVFRFFCLDPLNNFVITDYRSHTIRVFSPEGNLLHTIGKDGDRKGMFYYSTGVAVTPNGRLVCVSDKNYVLKIFC